MLAPQEKKQIKNIEGMVPVELLSRKNLKDLCLDLRDEIAMDYEMSARKCIGEF